MIEVLKLVMQLNWSKTLYIYFKMLPFGEALKFTILIWGRCRLNLKEGKIVFDAPLRRGMLKFGYRYEVFSYKEPVELIINGMMTIKGTVWIGTNVHLCVKKNAQLIMGNDSRIGSCCELTCSKLVEFSDNARIGSYSEITDLKHHYMRQLSDNAVHTINSPVFLGKNNYIGSRVAILPGTKTPNNTTIAFGTICNKDYRSLIPEYAVLAGIPAKVVKTNIARIFDIEKEKEIARYFEQTDSSVYYDNDAQ